MTACTRPCPPEFAHDCHTGCYYEAQEARDRKSCACTPATELFDLCPACADKAWHGAHIARKQPQRGHTYREVGPERTGYSGQTYREQQER